jgi:ubiquinone biosynthesis protein
VPIIRGAPNHNALCPKQVVPVKIVSILKMPRRTRRVAHIARTCASHGLGYLVSRVGIQQYLPARSRLPTAVGKWEAPADLPARFARVLEELGPVFVKFGQMLSTRPDLLPEDYVAQLQRICHHVAPFPGEVSRAVIEEELGRPVGDIFEEFSDRPLASGSIAQVHAARLKEGADVVVKVLRPGIERIIEDDLAIMDFLAGQAARLEEFGPLRLPMLVDEFRQGIRREQSLLSEAANTHKFWAAFRNDEKLRVPRVYWDYTTPRVLTLERLQGTHLTDVDKLPDPDQTKKEAAQVILDRFMVQFFKIGSFHADPHAGNILITADRRIALVDFGLIGRLGETLRSQLGTFIISLANQQFELAADVLGEIGSLPPEAEAGDFRDELALLLDRHYSVPLERLDLQASFHEVMQVVRKYRVAMPRDLVLLGKALVSVGGLVTQMDPSLNVAELARPYARDLAREKLAPRSIARALTSNAYHLGMLLRTAPREFRQLLRRLRTGAIEIAVDHRGLERYLVDLDRTGNRLALSIMLAAIIISSTSILVAQVGPTITLFGWQASALGVLGYLFGFLMGVWLVIGIFRSGRL